MNTSKWSLVSMLVLSLISTICPTNRLQQKRQAASAPASQTPKSPLYWEHILREFVFKTISPPPPGNNHLYRRLLEAPFYGGPFPSYPDDATSVVLSRGDVYYLPSGHWLLCQEGCVDCEVCRKHTYPSVKWALRRIKRSSRHGPRRQDLQLTIIPQIDGSYHMNSLWPRSYVYVTTQGEQAAYLSDKPGHEAAGSAYASLEDSFSGQPPGSNNFWRLVERDSLAERRVPGEQSNGTDPRLSSKSDSKQNVGTTVLTTADTTTEQNVSREPKKQRTRPKVTDGSTTNDTSTVVLSENEKERIRQLIPKLILGTDQLGQKHLVHVVPADASFANLTNLAMYSALNSAGLAQHQNRSAYHRILRRIYDSLASNKRFIQNFLEPRIQTGTNQPMEEHQQQETRHGFTKLGQKSHFYRVYSDGIPNVLPTRQRWPLTLNWNRQRRKPDGDVNATSYISNSISINRGSANTRGLYSDIRNVNINTTLGQDSRNGSVANRFNLNSIDRNYYNGNTFNGGTGMNNAVRNSREHGSGSRKFKIVVASESTVKPLNYSATITNHSQRTLGQNNLSTSQNRGIVFNNENGPLHFRLGNVTL